MCVAQPNISGAAGAARTGAGVVTGWMERAVVIGGAKGGAESSTFGGARSSQDGQFLHTIWQKRASDGDQTKACLECSGSRRARMTASG